jgi:protein-tyrosine phosphatase
MTVGGGAVRLPDGTVVHGAALADRDAGADWRSFGLYLDPRWRADWPHRFVDWPDLGLPADDADADEAIRDTLRRAQAGEDVEVGCAGGLGRTGTVLACMAVLTGIPAAQAVAWVRDHYAPAAVETPAQAAWVLAFAERADDRR